MTQHGKSNPQKQTKNPGSSVKHPSNHAVVCSILIWALLSTISLKTVAKNLVYWSFSDMRNSREKRTTLLWILFQQTSGLMRENTPAQFLWAFLFVTGSSTAQQRSITGMTTRPWCLQLSVSITEDNRGLVMLAAFLSLACGLWLVAGFLSA